MNFKYSFIFVLLVAAMSFADEDLEVPKGKVKVGLNYFTIKKSEFENTTFSTSDSRLSFQMSVPVYTTLGDAEDPKKERWSLDYKLTQHNLNTDLLKDSTAILAHQFLVSDKWIAENGEFYLLNIGGLNQTENKTNVSKSYAQVTFMGTYHHDLEWIYIYGLYYGSEVDGQFLLLPLLGLKTQLSADWDFLGILPLNLRFSRAINREAKLSFYIKPDAFRYDVANNGRYVQAAQTLTLQVQRYRAGVQWNQYLSRQLLVEAELGFMGKQKTKIFDSQQDYASETSASTGYLGVNLHFQF